MKTKNKSYSATLSDNDEEEIISSSNFDEEIRALIGCLSPGNGLKTNSSDSVADVLLEMSLDRESDQHCLTLEEVYQRWSEDTKDIVV